MILPALAALALSQAPLCAPPQGSDQLWRDPQIRFVIVGELHGTREAPAAFAEMVCDASAAGPVVVALELPVAMQASLDAWMASDGAPADRATFLQHDFWRTHADGDDGRNSEAMAAMIWRLHALKAAGRDVSVRATQPGARPRGFDQSYYEIEMAHAWTRTAYDRPEARVLILVGSLHAMKTRLTPDDFLFAAGLLDPAQVRSVRLAGQGGAAWSCPMGEPCGTHDIAPVQDAAMRGVVLQPVSGGAWDGWLALGPVTASPPASD